MKIRVPISLGELYDKISILEIKRALIKDQEKLINVKNELDELYLIFKGKNIDGRLFDRLKAVNLVLWRIEDKIREKEYKKEFDKEFIELSRKIYRMNDKRAKIKREINVKYKSSILEEKSYIGN